MLVLFGHRHHKTQIGTHQPFQGSTVTAPDTPGQLHFLFNSQQFLFADFKQVLFQ
jgi:hypothetical protein